MTTSWRTPNRLWSGAVITGIASLLLALMVLTASCGNQPPPRAYGPPSPAEDVVAPAAPVLADPLPAQSAPTSVQDYDKAIRALERRLAETEGVRQATAQEVADLRSERLALVLDARLALTHSILRWVAAGCAGIALLALAGAILLRASPIPGLGTLIGRIGLAAAATGAAAIGCSIALDLAVGFVVAHATAILFGLLGTAVAGLVVGGVLLLRRAHGASQVLDATTRFGNELYDRLCAIGDSGKQLATEVRESHRIQQTARGVQGTVDAVVGTVRAKVASELAAKDQGKAT